MSGLGFSHPGFSLFIFIWTVSYFYDRSVCEPKWQEIKYKQRYIASQGSILRIELFKESDDFQINLVSDTIVITDSTDIESIRIIINSRVTGTWNRPTPYWSAKMRLFLANAETLDFVVAKIDNDKENKMTHMYFGSKHCHDILPETSLVLGDYLETLTHFDGQLH